ncbi:MAG TPA: neuraminidase-like domain-containing protein [Thermoanaerobaculia bacterium]|nr:neuraminidase-like domain-containing protein [Thermoanaerobaculia bacterium]
MANLIIIRLHPTQPVDANTFTGYLKGLTITAFDLSVTDVQGTQPIGNPAQYLPTNPKKKSNPKNRIFQHYVLVPAPPSIPPAPPIPTLQAVATAVIEVPAGGAEYLSSDIRLEIRRGAETIADRSINYNVDLSAAALPNPNVVPPFPASVEASEFGGAVSEYLALPAPGPAPDPRAATLDLPADGTVPSFADVLAAVETVLRADPTVTGDADLFAKLASLSAAQCHHVASEIVWNRRLSPLPTPPRSLEEMYTGTHSATDPAEQDRQQFEGKLTAYYAVQNASATRLTGYVFAAASAVACEVLSANADRAGVTFPLITGASAGAKILEAGVIFTEAGSLNPPFLVPAAYFYALGSALPPQVGAAQRFDMARLEIESQLLTDFQTAVDAGTIAMPAAPVTVSAAPAINADQAARRLHALGSTTGSDPEVALPAPFAPLVGDWLAYAGASTDVDSLFWVPEVAAQPAAYLDLILRVVTGNYQTLIAAIKSNVTSVADLVQISDQQWRAFFLDAPLPPNPPPVVPFPPPLGSTAPRVALLPLFTQPGTPVERVEAFIRHLRKFFAVPYAPGAAQTVEVSAVPTFGGSGADVFARFTAAYSAHGGGTFKFGALVNQTALQAALTDPSVLPGDAEAQSWLAQALATLGDLFRMTDVGLPELRFSLMEALYARGFTDAASVNALSETDFQEALTGTVAYGHAADIYAKAGASGPATGTASGGFKPVNDGSLTDCVPPLHLSPLGPVEYLHELLRVSRASTCDNPAPESEAGSLATLLAGRRGPLGNLHATRANLETPLPLIDLVNESLEALAAGLPGATGGAVYDTAGDALAGHKLKGEGEPGHDPQTLFAALPEHSSPAAPVAKPGAFAKLKADFTAPGLPYAQALDVCRSYLGRLGSSRFAAMRHFRKEITELAIDPAHEPADFQRHLWRYPVRFDTAREYLRISADEYDLLYSRDNGVPVSELFGFPAGVPWTEIVVKVPEFLARTGLTYCEFLELWRSRFVVFTRVAQTPEGEGVDFPECLPCCASDLRIVFREPQDPVVALRELAVFIRLWRRLQELHGPKISFAQLRDICDVLHLFDSAGAINPDFLRQLAALLILRDDLRLPLQDDGAAAVPGATGADRTHLLALWVGPAAAKWDWAVALLLDRIEDYAEARHGCLSTGPEFMKLIAENLDPLSRLAGFDPATPTDTWHARPASTLRFAEVLSKIYASDFTVGEIIFLFTAGDHLDGDDPFPLPDPTEALDTPFDLPDEEEEHGLWTLRRKLLHVHGNEEEKAEEWSWPRIEAALRHELGFAPPAGGPDPLAELGEHFFPSVLEHHGHPVDAAKRRFAVDLAPSKTTAAMWNTPADGPFRYHAIDSTHGQLWTRLPLRDEAVAARLSEIRQLGPEEEAAVRDLYFAPRAALAPFALLFANFGEAIGRLVGEEDERERFAFFRHQFVRFHRRCHVIAEHLAKHVEAATGQEEPEGSAVALRVLRSLWADENRALNPWEDDSGKPPAVTWGPQPNGGAFAALLGLAGTGLLAEFSVPGPGGGKTTAWREVHGPLAAFGRERDERNAPVPCVVPSLALTLTPEQQRFAAVRNGFALRDADGLPLGGGQPFQVRWSGMLLVEHGGKYRFHAGAPTPHEEEPDFEAAEDLRWRLTLRRGQKTWTVLNHRWHRGSSEEAPAACSAPLALKAGAYQIVAELEQREPAFAREEDVCPRRCGFEVKYAGPDTGDCVSEIPLSRLFRDTVDATLGAGIQGIAGNAAAFLAERFTSSLRDVRRTYQRAFKGVLFAHRFRLAAKPVQGDRQSELGYLLEHGDEFLGTCYHRLSPTQIGTHHAWLDFNLLPVGDPFHSPALTPAVVDQRTAPSPQRQAALFDFWERMFDYTAMRRQTRPARERPAWLLFYEAAERQPDDPAQLLRHLGVDLRHAPLVLEYFATPTLYAITSPDLEDERWAVRVWHAERWLRALERHFTPRWIGDARPDFWAADDPALPAPGSGNENLTRFVLDGEFEHGEPRRYADVKRLDDGLRERARAALLAYLCGMDRVALPWGTGLHARVPRDLSDLLLQDVEAGICEKASRVEDAVRAVHSFVQRARLGLEPGFPVSPAFAQLWEKRFATFRVWEACKRREVYRENWIDWDELEAARKSDAFRFLESELRRATLTVAVPGGLEWWPAQPLPAHPSLTLLQAREPAEIRRLDPAPEGFGLLGTPERDARPSWLAPVVRAAEKGKDGAAVVEAGTPAGELERLPLWLQAAVRLGTRFLRIAAAGVPPASTALVPRDPAGEAGCCACCCGRVHPPVADEYYFWLEDSRSFEEVTQDADQGAAPPDDPSNDTTSDWHRPEKLPGLLHWKSEPSVHLVWSRVHNGEFQPPRRSDEELVIDPVFLLPGQVPQLDFKGRTADSLRFEVSGGKTPVGYLDPTPPGFRYDLATDSAVVLPLVVAPPAPNLSGFPGGLTAYPFFAWFPPGAPVEPPSPFSVAHAVAATLRAHCRFEAALKWYELAFNPLQGDDTWTQCPPHIDPVPNPDPAGHNVPVAAPAAVAPNPDIGRDGQPCCPSEPVSDEVARRRAILLHWLETLLQWSHDLTCRNSPEAFQQATVILDTLARVLGPEPARVLVRDDGKSPMTVAAFVPRPAPLNPRLTALYGRAADRLALVHHCVDGRRLRNGRPNLDMPYWGDDPLRDGWKAAEPGCCDDDCHSCCRPYRFMFLLQKALELAGEVRGLGAELLAAYEKGDGETLAALRSAHERQLLELALEVRQNQWRDADWQVQALRKTKEGAQTRKSHIEYQLIPHPRNANESGYEVLTPIAMMERAAGNIVDGISQSMNMIPDFWFGTTDPLITETAGGTKIAAAFAAAARILNTLADISGTKASLDLTEGGWDRRQEEWIHQVVVIGIEIEQIERQILGAERRRDAALRELNDHQRQIEHAVEVQDFLRDKFTNQELYLFLQQETAALYRQTYELARHVAGEAQRAFNYERGHTARTFLPDGAWDDLHEGLMAGERLQRALRQMEVAYLDANCREYELTKHVSLRLNFPLAFLHLLATGACEIEIPEWMFDLDYPGHYMRRIKNVTLTLPCVVGPYTGVHCRLTLLSSVTRVDPRLAPSAGCCDESGPVAHYRARPGDARVVRSYAATEAIATSSGQNDSGLFELSFRDERYLPFELAGAISRWRLELPPENNQFGLDSLSDAVLHLNYTAREGGDVLRRAANESAQEHLPGAGLRLFDVRHDFPEAWHRLHRPAGGGRGKPGLLPLRLGRERFPFLTGHRDVRVRRLELFFELADPDGRESLDVRFLARHEREHGGEEACECGGVEVGCVASGEWPCLYHGVLDLPQDRLDRLGRGHEHDLGTLRFPCEAGTVTRAFLVCGYETWCG